MTTVDLTRLSKKLNRADLRKEIIGIFLEEEPGTGKLELTTRYRYVTKKLSDGREVYLQRPANFNNGFDFTLNVTGTNFNAYIPKKRASTRPTHDSILYDLKNKKKENPKLYIELLKCINSIYACKTPIKSNLKFKSGHSVELLFECIKWLFVEQDVTYWNYSGRAMFYSSIMKI